MLNWARFYSSSAQKRGNLMISYSDRRRVPEKKVIGKRGGRKGWMWNGWSNQMVWAPKLICQMLCSPMHVEIERSSILKERGHWNGAAINPCQGDGPDSWPSHQNWCLDDADSWNEDVVVALAGFFFLLNIEFSWHAAWVVYRSYNKRSNIFALSEMHWTFCLQAYISWGTGEWPLSPSRCEGSHQ